MRTAERHRGERSQAVAWVDREGLPAVVLVGRANAGKSTLFNRIARGARAITSPIPGTTRDLNFARAKHGDREFVVVDSGGLELGGQTAMSDRVVREALGAVGSADLVVFMFDGRLGLSDVDREALGLVRETGAPLVVAVNKIDNPSQQANASEFYAIGADELFFISAAHGGGVGELLDEIVEKLPASKAARSDAPGLKLALIGRPNVGKSSLLNRVVGFERAIVDEIPGTTRDPVDVRVTVQGRSVMLIDTAGIRRPTRVEGELEHHSVGRAIETIRRADVAILVIDTTEGVTDQDARLARLAESNGRAMVIVCNKWDAAAKLGRRIPVFVRDAHDRYPFMSYATMQFTSALKGDGVGEVLPAAIKAGDSWRSEFQTSRLNRLLAEAVAAMDPPIVARRRLNMMYVTQVGSAPPRLAFFTNVERDIPAHYVRFLESRFRSGLGLVGTPLKLEFRRTGRSWMAEKPAPRRATKGRQRS